MNSVAIFFSPTKKWNDGYYLCSSSVSSSKMLWSLYVDSNAFPIVIGGKGSIYFFRVVRGINEKVKGVYGKRIKIQPILCGIEGDVPTGGGEEKAIICGTVSGHLYVFSNYKVTDKVSAHEGSVTVIARCQQGYVSGGKEGMVKIWSHDFKVLHTYRTSYFVPRPYGLSCHAVATNKLGTNIIIGMRSDELFEVSLMSNSTSLLIDGHSILEQNALDVNPQNPDEYVTGGDDGVIRVWSISRRYCLRKVMIDFACRAICWSPDGNNIVVGIGGVASMASKDGKFTIYYNIDNIDNILIDNY
jgi:microtubule-associated protein-like 6